MNNHAKYQQNIQQNRLLFYPSKFITNPTYTDTQDTRMHVLKTGTAQAQTKDKNTELWNWMKPLTTVLIQQSLLREMHLTEHHMPIKHRFALLLDLPSPALLGVLHFVQHIRPRVCARQHIMGIRKRLLVLLFTKNKDLFSLLHQYYYFNSSVFLEKCRLHKLQ